MAPTVCISAVPRSVQTGYGIDEADTISARLIAGVVAAGATPVVLPVVPADVARAQLADASGLILSGGHDLALEGETTEEGRWIDPARDRHELALWAAARARGLPVLGICRGMQLVNVALGGTLIPEVPNHDAGPDREIATHQVTCAPGSQLAKAVGAPACAVNTIHHQAIAQLGRGLVTTAWAPDRCIEAVEATEGPWFVGVQWHPELMLDAAAGQALLNAFVAACEQPAKAVRAVG